MQDNNDNNEGEAKTTQSEFVDERLLNRSESVLERAFTTLVLGNEGEEVEVKGVEIGETHRVIDEVRNVQTELEEAED